MRLSRGGTKFGGIRGGRVKPHLIRCNRWWLYLGGQMNIPKRKKNWGLVAYVCYRVKVIGQAKGYLILVEIQEDRQGICSMNAFNDDDGIRTTYLPATESSSSPLRPKNSIANREASGEEALCVGGVGNDADGADGDTRASKDSE